MTTIKISDLSLVKPHTHIPSESVVDMRKVASVILGGGEGTRLYPFTLTRCKPAIPFGGIYRIIDFAISNSIHADCSKTFILTQFLSSSLHHHIFQTYMQGRTAGLIEILTAEQKPNQKNWFQGTADAVRQNINYLLENPVDYFLILSGDQLYDFNFREMVQFAKNMNADVVIAALPINAQDATRMGVLKVNNEDLVTDFYEKPHEASVLAKFKSPAEVIERAGVSFDSNRNYLGSMGIYLFKRDALVKLLLDDPREDFGKHLIPTQLKKGKVAAYLYDGYWEDIGTVETFYKANMDLTNPYPHFDFYDESRPIITQRYDLPPAKFLNAQVKHSILCEGSMVDADEITHSILGPRSVIHKGAIIRDSYVMGNDYYESPNKDHHNRQIVPHIGENSILSKVIVDKNATIGKRVQLINKQKLSEYNSENVFIRDGIIIIPRGAVIPDGFIL